MSSLKEKLARLRASVFPFRTLNLAEKTFGNLPSPSYRTFPFFNFQMTADVARSSAQQLLFLNREKMIEDRHLISDLLKPGMTVVDVGANIGYYMLMFRSMVGDNGKIICIEPSPENLPELKKNIESNALKNVELHEVAIGKDSGNVNVRGGINSGVVQNDGIASVPLRRLDSLVETKVDFVKIDVDGYEGQVLEGAVELLKRDKPILYLEVHPHMIPRFDFSVRKILDLLEPIYSDITTYWVIPPEDLSPMQKLSERYSNKNAMKIVEDPEELYRVSDEHQRNRTFWLICK